ncbi:VC0807 family protein [Opitutus terrae]|uniref:MFS transporter n=1 Tax=Opitutus terrae (strain DSM 11246 / JCM 15787 / PB90-1) TaxID=452637 RepID=B1ZNA7_OPITP|nr:VC0807 family protein [Opitutus terrae]ACB73476.1 conserved hypothetical protein [Opitutus terrae PB90-1]
MTSAPAKKESLLFNLLFSVVLPALVLSKLSTPERLGPVFGLVVALAFPIGYGVLDYVRRRQANFITLIGFFSTLLTGGLGLVQANLFWFAIKEAAVPTVIGIAVLVSLKTKRPLVHTFLYNDQVIDVARVDAALALKGTRPAFERLLVTSSYLLAFSFLVSAVLNYALARYLLKSPPGTPEFNEQLSRMLWLSWPVIVVPSTAVTVIALWRLLGGLHRLTGLSFEEIFHAQGKK